MCQEYTRVNDLLTLINFHFIWFYRWLIFICLSLWQEYWTQNDAGHYPNYNTHTHLYINTYTYWCLTALTLTYTSTHLLMPYSLASLFPCCMVLIPPHTLHGALLPKHTLSGVLPPPPSPFPHTHTDVLVTGTYPSDRYLGCFFIWIISSSLSSTSVFLVRHDTTVSIFLEIPSHFCISLTMTCRTRRISLHPLMMS